MSGAISLPGPADATRLVSCLESCSSTKVAAVSMDGVVVVPVAPKLEPLDSWDERDLGGRGRGVMGDDENCSILAEVCTQDLPVAVRDVGVGSGLLAHYCCDFTCYWQSDATRPRCRLLAKPAAARWC